VESLHNANYNTAVSVNALVATGNEAYADIIRNAQSFLKGLQIDERTGYPADHRYYGGIGYGGDERPDMANQVHALEALRASALDADDPVWEKALIFVSRSQNNSETNDQDWAANDGGFTYMPGAGSPFGGTGSYGSMTHAGLFSMLMAGVDKSDERVQAAYEWIRNNYTLEDNPGVEGGHNLFFYYNVLAKTLALYGEPEIVDADGAAHNWRNDLATRLISMQAPDGSWVNPRSTRFWEGNKDLVTAWSVIALNTLVRPPGKSAESR
jgi:squalene-hopene/tetraprenyl-beta-curcumene cyclase